MNPAPRVLTIASLGLLVALGGGSLGCSRPTAEVERVRDASSQRALVGGEVVGFTAEHGNHAWLGLPFAAPPIGERRWRAPGPPAPWVGVREALAARAPCPQNANPLAPAAPEIGAGVVGDEDCLYLNVYAPRFEPDAVPRGAARLPVMVWIHGGGNTIGSAGNYDGGRLARQRDVIVVTTSYRLGALGWFRHPSLASASADARDRSGNYATLDLVRALEWVRDNAAAFGGDPGNVTIFGESAGAQNVFTLLVAPGARGLFQRAIAQSGGTLAESPARAEHYRDDPEPGHPFSSAEVVLGLLQAEGKAGDRASARTLAQAMRPEELASWLRGKSPAELLAVYTQRRSAGMYDVPRVFSDGEVLPRGRLLDALAAGRYHRVPTVLGTNRDEQKLFMLLDPVHVRRWFWRFPRPRDPLRYQREAEYTSLMWKARGADEPAARMVSHQPGRVWVYRFDWDEEPRVFISDFAELLGAAHGLEIPFVFGRFEAGALARLFDEANAPGRERLSNAMMAYWTEFARTGRPGRGGTETLPDWEPWSREETGPKFLVLDTDEGGGLRMSNASVTREGVLAALAGDARIQDPAERCAIYRHFLGRTDITPADYALYGCGDEALEQVARR